MNFELVEDYDDYKGWIDPINHRRIRWYNDLNPRDYSFRNIQPDGTNPGYTVSKPSRFRDDGLPRYGYFVNEDTPFYESYDDAVNAAKMSLQLDAED